MKANFRFPLVFLLTALLTCALARAEDESIFDTNPAPTAPITEKTAVVILPDAYRAALANGQRVGESTVVSVDLIGGLGMTGARVEAQVWSGDGKAVELEALGGVGLTAAGWYPMAGGGARVQFTVAEGQEHRNALMVSPGLDLYVLTGSSTGGGYLGLIPYTNVYYLATNVDVEYVHQFARHFAWDIGVRVGADIGLAGTAADGKPATEHPSPELGLFTGLRF